MWHPSCAARRATSPRARPLSPRTIGAKRQRINDGRVKSVLNRCNGATLTRTCRYDVEVTGVLGSGASRMNRRPTVRMTDPVDDLVRFGAFELDLRTGELRRSGVRIHLPDQPFQVLRALLDRPGDLVTREELRQRLWAAETFVDFERGLNAAVRRLRDALGDSADVPRFVETLPRRGYRFIAPVSRQPAARESRAARSRDRGRSHPDT